MCLHSDVEESSHLVQWWWEVHAQAHEAVDGRTHALHNLLDWGLPDASAWFTAPAGVVPGVCSPQRFRTWTALD